MTDPSSIKPKQWPIYRPIAPSIPSAIPQPPLFKSSWDDYDKRKRGDSNGPDVRMRTGSVESDGDSINSRLGESSHALTAEQKLRRKEQNRAAQRAFRDRKERYVKELETKIKFMEDTHATSMQRVQRESEDLRNPTGTTATATMTTTEEMAPAAKRIMRVAPSAVACIRDKDGISFCERLKEEVCSSAYDQLLSEPLFDPSSGVFNDAVTQHPVPIAAGGTFKNNNVVPLPDAMLRHDFDRFMDSMTDRTILDPATHETKLVPCNEIWERVSEHPQFEQFDLDLLCEELKRKAKCSHDGTVLEEDELSQVLRKMEASLGGPER
ncbi:hypothetical protein BDB00DRAFT_963813 [Zychaea mexicana]|uniref:uncharacterized protein n=1 Tax=Zychaea mexicana TaxID=64656 RepID=UPI0022FF2CD1|nr:uncharacterized protein BDB00DRAFT_963813 [Zychaea mexicana]KAI9488361.1 hypothetical protein BDB00DRAFT_963813 [Zychaea mexicana]